MGFAAPTGLFRTARRCAREEASEDLIASINSMRAREMKEELESAGVDTSDLFDKESLSDRLLQLRTGALDTSAPVQETSAQPAAATESTATAEPSEQVPDQGRQRLEEALVKCRAMRVKELRTELGTRGISWADAFEKSELEERLAPVLAAEADFSRSRRLSPGLVGKLSGAELEQELKASSTPMLLDVYATWCGPCKMMAPQLEAAAKSLGQRVRIAKMDSDEEVDWSTRLQVGGLPTLILFDRAGNEITRQEGALMEQQIMDLVSKAGI